ncbi:ribonuclease H-like domain-containing protein [Tanacetum coccineum]
MYEVLEKWLKDRIRVVEFERCEEGVLEARVNFAHFVHYGERILCYGTNLEVDQVNVVDSSFLEVILPSSSNKDEGVWLMFGGAIDNARVVLRVVGMRLFSWSGEDSFEEMSMTLLLVIFLGGFFMDEEALEAILKEIKGGLEVVLLRSFGGVRTVIRDLDVVHKVVNIRDSKRMGGMNMPIEACEEHSTRKHHEVAFDYTFHSHGNVVSKIEWFLDGKAIEHVHETSVCYILVSGEAYGIFAKNGFPVFEVEFHFEVYHLIGIENNSDAFNDPNWKNSMTNEYNALIKNNTWTLVPRPMDTNIVRCMWLFHHKYLADGTLSRYKACLVANGSTQIEGINVDETFSPVVKPGIDTAYLLLYVDDVLLTASSEILLHRIITSIHQEFSITDLGSLNYFLGISVTHDSLGMFLSQRKYAIEILDRDHMVNYNPCQNPIDTESKLGDDGDLVSDPTLYRCLAGSLQYLTFTRPDISYVVQQVCLHMHDPREPYFSALKRILRYVRGTLDYGLWLFSSSATDLFSKCQPTVSRSSVDAEYLGVSNAVAETCWLRNLLHLVAAGQVQVLHVPSRYQYADIFTRGLPSALFEDFRTSLSIRCPFAPTVWEC